MRIGNEQWSALTSAIGMSKSALGPTAHELAWHAIFARQGCSKDQCKPLRAALAQVRAQIVAEGGSPIYVERTNWQRIMDIAREKPEKLDGGDTLRLVVIGEHALARARLPALREKHHGNALALVVDWVLTSTFDRSAALALVNAATTTDNYDWMIEHVSDEISWLLLLEPNDIARDVVRERKQRVAKQRKQWRRGENGDTDEHMEFEIARSACQRVIVDSWKKPDAAVAAIDKYIAATFSYWNTEDLLLAVALREQLSRTARLPRDAYGKLRSHIRESLEPIPPRSLADDPGLAALDILDAALARGAGLTVKTDFMYVTILAEPQAADPDFF
jgi:hypothetical protein